MQWISYEIANPDRGEGWWVMRAPYYPLAYWLARFQTTLIGYVSGSSGALGLGS